MSLMKFDQFDSRPLHRETITQLLMVNVFWVLEIIMGPKAENYSPFQLTSLIYAEKFEFENPAIMEDKQFK